MTVKTSSVPYSRRLMNLVLLALLLALAGCQTTSSAYIVQREAPSWGSYPIVGTGQSTYWGTDGKEMVAPAKGDALYGQDAQHPGTAPSYHDNGDGTVSDNVTGLMWTQTTDLNGDGVINKADKLNYAQAMRSAAKVTKGGYGDWRLPTIKELYSLIRFDGQEPRPDDTNASIAAISPFIDQSVFGFGYGELAAGERIIDSNFASSTLYTAKTTILFGPVVGETETMFGVNFADGRIKGYPVHHGFYVLYVRGNLAYGVNDLRDNGDGTITDRATKLMWSQADSAAGMNWEEALAWVQAKNAANYLGHNDWRLPNIKELQSLVDYSRSPASTDSAAIDPLFSSTGITDEAGQPDWGCYWSSTTHRGMQGEKAAYVALGRAMGLKGDVWGDVHGAGAQRSDPKVGNAEDYPDGRGPQGDAIRIDNYVRLVRDADRGLGTAWRGAPCDTKEELT
jgi:hypothetical protein